MLQCLRGFAFCVLTAVASSAHAGPQDDLLLREALKADQRMYDNFQAFAKALRAAVGGEPKLSALEVSENTGGALVRQDDGRTRSFSFVEGKLTEPSGNPLRDEAPPDQQLSGRFTFGDIDLNKVRAALKVQRAKPGHIGDTAPELWVRYRAVVGRWIVGIQVGSMAIAGLDLVSYDFRTGEAVRPQGYRRQAQCRNRGQQRPGPCAAGGVRCRAEAPGHDQHAGSRGRRGRGAQPRSRRAVLFPQRRGRGRADTTDLSRSARPRRTRDLSIQPRQDPEAHGQGRVQHHALRGAVPGRRVPMDHGTAIRRAGFCRARRGPRCRDPRRRGAAQ